jgi:hypothetical protein
MIDLVCENNENTLKNIQNAFTNIFNGTKPTNHEYIVEMANDFKKTKTINVQKILYKFKYYKITRPKFIYTKSLDNMSSYSETENEILSDSAVQWAIENNYLGSEITYIDVWHCKYVTIDRIEDLKDVNQMCQINALINFIINKSKKAIENFEKMKYDMESYLKRYEK